MMSIFKVVLVSLVCLMVITLELALMDQSSWATASPLISTDRDGDILGVIIHHVGTHYWAATVLIVRSVDFLSNSDYMIVSLSSTA